MEIMNYSIWILSLEAKVFRIKSSLAMKASRRGSESCMMFNWDTSVSTWLRTLVVAALIMFFKEPTLSSGKASVGRQSSCVRRHVKTHHILDHILVSDHCMPTTCPYPEEGQRRPNSDDCTILRNRIIRDNLAVCSGGADSTSCVNLFNCSVISVFFFSIIYYRSGLVLRIEPGGVGVILEVC